MASDKETVSKDFRSLIKCRSATFQLDGCSYTIVATAQDSKSQRHHDDDPSNEDLDPIIAHAGDRNGQMNHADSQLTILKTTQRQRGSLNKLGRVCSSTSGIDENKLNEDDIESTKCSESYDKVAKSLRDIADQLMNNSHVSNEFLENTLQCTIDALNSIRNRQTRSNDGNMNSVNMEKDEKVIKRNSCELSRKESTTSKTVTPGIKSAGLRKTCEEDDELSEVEPSLVPSEVREWLASTFTRQAETQRRRSDEKPKFRSVANAIRAGIFVDRIYRRMSSSVGPQIPSNIAALLKSIDNWSFDVFAVNEAANGQCLRYISNELLNRYGLIHKFKMPIAKLENFLVAIESGYCKNKNPYHNNIHAADVTQTVHFMIYKTGIMNWLTDLEMLAVLIAAIIHDFEHNGTTNNFHVMSGSRTALLYNDRAVLENHHISSAFCLLLENENNFLSHLSKPEYREFRSLVIEMVLSTDMSSHFQQIKTMKKVLARNTDVRSAESSMDKSKALSLLLHCSDISHPAKGWNLHYKWTMSLLEEFFQQGDQEKDLGLPYSPLCDRNNTLVAESQIGFIDFIVDPSMQVCGDMIDNILAMQAKDAEPPEGKEARNQSATSLPAKSSQISIKAPTFNSAPSTPRTILKKPPPVITRHWVDCLIENKKLWTERAKQDAAIRAEKEKAEAENKDEVSDVVEVMKSDSEQ